MSDEAAAVGGSFARALFARGRKHWSRPHEPTTAVWREHALAEIAAREFSLERLRDKIAPEQRATIHRYLQKAREAATDSSLSRRRTFWSAWRGATVERTWALIDAAEESLLQVAPDDFVTGQLPRIRRRARQSLAADDPRRIEVEEIARRQPSSASTGRSRELLVSAVASRLGDATLSAEQRAGLLAALTASTPPRYELTQQEREVLVTTFHASNAEARKKQTRVRSFRNMLLAGTLALTIAAAGLAVLGVLRPDVAPLCFQPGGQVVCPTETAALDEDASAKKADAESAAEMAKADLATRKTVNDIDVPFIELMGLIGAALACATSLRRMRGTSTPYSVPLALTVLKLPTGALTAVLGLLLMRGEFVPGLTALDSPAQIVAWAIIFGYSQQLFTRFVDQRGQTVLDSAGSRAAPARPAAGRAAPGPRPDSL